MKKENKSKKEDAITTQELISQLLGLDPNLTIVTMDECDFDEEDE